MENKIMEDERRIGKSIRTCTEKKKTEDEDGQNKKTECSTEHREGWISLTLITRGPVCSTDKLRDPLRPSQWLCPCLL